MIAALIESANAFRRYSLCQPFGPSPLLIGSGALLRASERRVWAVNPFRWRCALKSKALGVSILGLGLFLGASEVQAGTVRYAGKKISHGSTAVAGATVDGVQAAGDGLAAGGKATGSACKTGVTSVGKGAKATPGLTVRGVKGAGKGIAKAIW